MVKKVNQEINKIKIRRSKGGSEENCTSSWKYFSALQFLLPSIQSKTPQPILGQNLCETQLVIVDNIPEDDKFQIISNDSRVIEQKFNLRRTNVSDDEESLPEEKVVVKRRKDDFELFGEYVALELRSLRSDYYRRKLKSEIRRAIVRIADEEDSMY
ncbi:Uncharacterized protein GBIM_05116 [Gryllus bimaculatus]|nr:Uncharacterized protein GBIM_05116 [Gryllus bimaculatus]